MTRDNNRRVTRALRARGEDPVVVERFIYQAKRYLDAWGIVDIISVAPDGHIRFIQVFSATNGGNEFRSHYQKLLRNSGVVSKILSNPLATIELWGWRGKQPTMGRMGYFIVWRFRSLDEPPEKVRVYSNGREEAYRYVRRET